MCLVSPFNNKLCNSTLLITEHQPTRASFSSPRAPQSPERVRCSCSVLGGGTGLGTELPGGSTCADPKSSSWAAFPAEPASGRRGDGSCCPSHSWSSTARPEASDVLAQKPERALGFWRGSGFNALLEPVAPCALSCAVQPHTVIPVPYGPLKAEQNGSSLDCWHSCTWLAEPKDSFEARSDESVSA